jgi:hypothetical protein
VPPLSTLAALIMLAAAARAAPSAEEQRLYADGMKAYAAGDARGAERAFNEGYGIAHDPAFLVHMAEAEEKAGARAEAAETYRRYLREAPDAADRADIEQRIARLAPPAARESAPPRDASEEPGELGAAAPAEPAPAAAARPAVVSAADAEAARRVQEDSGSGWTRYNVTAMVAAGATLALLGTAGFFGAQASSRESDVNRLQSFRDDKTGAPIEYSKVAREYEQALADGRSDEHAARVALLAAAGTAAVSVLFFVLDAHFTDAAAVAVAPAPASAGGGATLVAAWRF